MGDIGIRLKMKNDDEPIRMENGEEFVASQVDSDFNIRVAGHSHSPLFTMETEELATLLLKAKAADQEMFIRMLNTPFRGPLIHALHKRQKAEALMRQQQAVNPQPPAKPARRDRSGED